MGITRGLRKTWPTKSKESQGLCGARKGNEINLSSSRSLNQLLCLIATRMRPVVKLNSNPRTSLHFVPVRGIPSENTWPNCVRGTYMHMFQFARALAHPYPCSTPNTPSIKLSQRTQNLREYNCIKRIGNKLN